MAFRKTGDVSYLGSLTPEKVVKVAETTTNAVEAQKKLTAEEREELQAALSTLKDLVEKTQDR